VWDVWLVLAGDCLVGSCLPRLLLARSLVCASVSLSVSSCSLLALSIDSPATYLPNASPHRVNTTRVPWCDGRCTCQLQSLSFYCRCRSSRISLVAVAAICCCRHLLRGVRVSN